MTKKHHITVFLGLEKSLTLVNDDEAENGTVVSVLLFGVAGKAGVLPLILKGNIRYQDRNVTVLTGSHEFHAFMVDHHMGLQTLSWDDSFTNLKETESLAICGDSSYHLYYRHGHSCWYPYSSLKWCFISPEKWLY